MVVLLPSCSLGIAPQLLALLLQLLAMSASTTPPFPLHTESDKHVIDIDSPASGCVNSSSADGQISLSLCYSATGEVERLAGNIGGKSFVLPFRLSLNVSACRTGAVSLGKFKLSNCDVVTGQSVSLIHGSIAVTPFVVPDNERAPPHERTSRAAIKIETVLSPFAAGDFVSPVVTSFGFQDGKRRELWTTDGKPAVTATFDPLLAYTPRSAHSFPYGGAIMDGRGTADGTLEAGGLVQPALTILDEQFGLTVALSPEDKTVFNRLNISTSSTYAFDRFEERFGTDDVNLTTVLYLHEADWRPALGAVRDTWPDFVYPNASVNASAFDGLMAYADYRGDEAAGGPTGGTDIPFATLQAMGTKVNWDASFPFMGTPFVGEGGINGGQANWTTCYPHPDNPVPSHGPRAGLPLPPSPPS